MTERVKAKQNVIKVIYKVNVIGIQKRTPVSGGHLRSSPARLVLVCAALLHFTFRGHWPAEDVGPYELACGFCETARLPLEGKLSSVCETDEV